MFILPFDKVHLAEPLAKRLNQSEEGANELALDDELGYGRLLIQILMDHLCDLCHDLRCQHHLLHEFLDGRAHHVSLLADQLEEDAHMPLKKLAQLLLSWPHSSHLSHHKLLLCLLVDHILFLTLIIVFNSHLHDFLRVYGGRESLMLNDWLEWFKA